MNIKGINEIQGIKPQPGQFDRPAPGTYLMKIVSVVDGYNKKGMPMISISLDIGAGVHAGAFEKFPRKLYQNYDPNNMAGFRWLIDQIVRYNPTAAIVVGDDFKEQSLVGCYIPCIIKDEKKDDKTFTAFMVDVDETWIGDVPLKSTYSDDLPF